MAHLSWLESNFDFSKMTDMVVYGCSAGGLAVYTWIDYINDRFKAINSKLNFYGYADSGLFLIYPMINTNDNYYSKSLGELYKISNEEIEFPAKACVDAN